jgi:hypothetical protein
MPFVGPLDLVPGACLAMSPARALSAAWIGQPVIRLRRASDDAELDFVAGADGSVSVAAVATWAGGNSFCVTLYDQSGSGLDVTNATASQQPKWIANAQNSRPALQFVSAATQQLLPTDRMDLPIGETSVFVVFNHIGDGNSRFLIGANVLENDEDPYWEVRLAWHIGEASGNYRVEQWATPNNAGTFNDIATDVSSGLHLFESAWKFGSGVATLNGAPQTYTNALDSGGLVAQIDQPTCIGTGDPELNSTNQVWDGYIAEEIVYPVVLSAPNRSTLRGNIATYYGITLPDTPVVDEPVAAAIPRRRAPRHQPERYYLPPGKYTKKRKAEAVREVKKLYQEARKAIPKPLQAGLISEGITRDSRARSVLPPASEIDFEALTQSLETIRVLLASLEATKRRRRKEEAQFLILLMELL